MPFGLCNAPAPFQRLMQNCLGELNLMYCLIYLDDVIVFSKIKEEHLKHLCIVFDHFWEHNLKLKPTKIKFFWDEINYLAHHVSKEGMWPSKENLKAVAEFTLHSKLTPKSKPSWAWWGTIGDSSRGLHVLCTPLHEHLSGEGACKKREQVTLMVEAKDAFETLKRACLKAPVLAFADFDKPFLLETNASKLGLGAVLS